MNNNTSQIEMHYSRDHLYENILQILQSAGIPKESVTRADIAAVDEFHIRGTEVSRELAAGASLQPGMRVLDAGCGLGGACRMLADEFACHVTGIDITGEYIRTAEQLSALTGLQQATRFVKGSVLELPFSNDYFDMVWTQHVQMNIADKQKFYSEINRVLTKNGRFIYYDILSNNQRPLQFPVPWASGPSLSFLITSQQLEQLLQQAGLQRRQVTDETEKGIAFLNKLLTRIAEQGLPALGIHLLMGHDAVEKLKNVYKNLVEEKIKLESGIYVK